MMAFPRGTSRDDVIAMAMKGIRPADIIRKTGLGRNTVYADIYWARRHGIRLPTFRRGPSRDTTRRNLCVSEGVFSALGAAAVARGISTTMLAERLLTTIARDGLADAILDDGAGHVS